MKTKSILIFLFASAIWSCSVSPAPINYNYDECAFCKMKISDVRFGAEIVTSKGKIFKYDSAECLVRTHLEDEQNNYAYVLVTDYINPHNLIDAETDTFLISENKPSPMGGNLSAYEDKGMAQKVLSDKGGKLLSFEELLGEYKETYQ